jgi:CheY-like chemotaxis protein
MTVTIKGLVLVVDDVESSRMLGEAFLVRSGWRVRTFDGAKAVLGFVRNIVPEAMLIDVRMPGLAGDKLVQVLRQEAATRSVRLVAYTALTQPEELHALRAGGFDDVLLKPASLADFAKVLPRDDMVSRVRVSAVGSS